MVRVVRDGPTTAVAQMIRSAKQYYSINQSPSCGIKCQLLLLKRKVGGCTDCTGTGLRQTPDPEVLECNR